MPPPDLHLVLLSEAHLDDVQAAANDPEVARFTMFPVPAPADFSTQFYARYQAGRESGTREAFAAVAADGRFLGLALAPEINVEGREMELGYLVAAAERGRGVATELLRQLTEWAFGSANALRVSLTIAADNAGSKLVATRCGYQREGVLRSSYFKQGTRTDAELWGRLSTDPLPAAV
ncbi:MAG: GNAT family N-acetyltransferase [Actinomycetota bacterium]|nr:GNAT family N-acetyltransferase [Actinomycetota bacterium]MDQ2956670.1 GNAT family N-acetyltransferase [Actinomycetota bacterium]